MIRRTFSVTYAVTLGTSLATLAVGAASARSELVSQWRLDGNAKDSAGANHGTLYGDPVWVEDRYGNPGKALKLDGQNDYVNCGSDVSLSFGDGNTDRPFSISVWAKTDTWSGFAIASKGGEYWVDHNDLFRIRLHGKGSFIGGTGGGHDTDKWVHLAVTYDGSGQAEGVMLYVNGSAARRAEASGSYAAMKPARGNFVIGRCSKHARGVIDDVKIFNHALTPVEVKKLADVLFELDVQNNVKVLQRQQGQLAAEVTVNVTNLSPLPRKADLRAALNVAEQTGTAARHGILFSPGTHTHTIAVPVPATGYGTLSVALEDSEHQRVVCRGRLPLTLDYRPLKVDVLRPHYQNAALRGRNWMRSRWRSTPPWVRRRHMGTRSSSC